MTDENGAVASEKKPELRLPSQVDPAIAAQLAQQPTIAGELNPLRAGPRYQQLRRILHRRVIRQRRQHLSRHHRTF